MKVRTIKSFTGEYRWLSNFFPSPVTGADGWLYPTVEHAFQAAKTGIEVERERIRTAQTPGEAKRLGKEGNAPSGLGAHQGPRDDAPAAAEIQERNGARSQATANG